MAKNSYNIEKIIDALNNHKYTNFLTRKEMQLVCSRIHKNEYNIYELYDESNKVIIYKKEPPEIKLYEIVSRVSLRHQDILGTIFSLGLKEDTFGDLIKYEDHFYIFLLPSLEDYFIYNLTTIKDNPIVLKNVDLSLSQSFKQAYQVEEYIVSSLRIDNVISTITKESREKVLNHFKEKEIILNYSEELKPTRIIKENDIFSIRKFGKYRYLGIKKNTKKGRYIIAIAKYV